jgi:hypothetical protein
MGHVVDFLDRNLKLFEAEKLLLNLPKLFDVFPSLAQIEDCVPSFRERPVISKNVDQPWQSKRAAGTPASVEALFLLIEKGLSNSSAFRTGLGYLRATEAELWQWYEAWIDGTVHPDLEKRKKELLLPWIDALSRRNLHER